MKSNQQFPSGETFPHRAYLLGGAYMYNAPVAPTLGATLPSGTRHLRPFHGVQLQPSEVCPKNFIIFDQTNDKSRIMFHPALTHKFSCPGSDIHAKFVQDNDLGRKDAHNDKTESSTPLKEDSRDIDALLSLDDEGEGEEEEEDEEEVSTARTRGSYGNSSPDSCSSYGPKRSKRRRMSSSIQKSFSGCSKGSNSERKLQRMKKMVKALKGIVPGADQMNTAAVLDEAVRYLKSLKVELKKLGITNLKN